MPKKLISDSAIESAPKNMNSFKISKNQKQISNKHLKLSRMSTLQSGFDELCQDSATIEERSAFGGFNTPFSQLSFSSKITNFTVNNKNQKGFKKPKNNSKQQVQQLKGGHFLRSLPTIEKQMFEQEQLTSFLVNINSEQYGINQRLEGKLDQMEYELQFSQSIVNYSQEYQNSNQILTGNSNKVENSSNLNQQETNLNQLKQKSQKINFKPNRIFFKNEDERGKKEFYVYKENDLPFLSKKMIKQRTLKYQNKEEDDHQTDDELLSASKKMIKQNLKDAVKQYLSNQLEINNMKLCKQK